LLWQGARKFREGAKILCTKSYWCTSGKYGVQGFPTIKFMYHDGSTIKAVDYKGGRTAKELITFGMDKAHNLALKRIGESTKRHSGGGSAKDQGSGGVVSCMAAVAQIVHVILLIRTLSYIWRLGNLVVWLSSSACLQTAFRLS
jgi:hypothetical protein